MNILHKLQTLAQIIYKLEHCIVLSKLNLLTRIFKKMYPNKKLFFMTHNHLIFFFSL